jgi:hypothetical protein
MKHDFMAVFVWFYAFSPFGVIFVRQGELPEMWRAKYHTTYHTISDNRHKRTSFRKIVFWWSKNLRLPDAGSRFYLTVV